MKDFIEKVKDILYNGMDYIVMAGIIIVIGLIINWRIGGLFTSDIDDAYNDMTQEKLPITSENGEDVSGEEEAPDQGEDQDKNVDKSSEEDDEEIIKIEIPSGVYPSDIGDILVSNGLIENKEFFLNEVIESGVESGLRSGDYEIPKNSSLEDIIDILVR